MQEKENKFRRNREPKKPVKVEMNNPDAVNPELEERKELTPLQFLDEMIEQIKSRKKQFLEQIKQLRDKTQIQAQIKRVQDMIYILNIDLKHTLDLRQMAINFKPRKR